MSVSVRRALYEELPRVNELREMVNRLHVEGRPDIFRPGFNEEMRDHLYVRFGAEDAEILVALTDGSVAGFVMLDWIDKPGSPYNLPRRFCHVAEIGVDANCRRRGVGRALMEGIRAACREKGFSRVELDVWAFNDSAYEFYENTGFTCFRRFMEMEV